MLENISFNSPNTLENNLNYHYHTIFVKRTGLCPDFVITPCIHANIVQEDWVNPVIGNQQNSAESLLQKFKAGYVIDLDKFYFKKGGEVQFMNYEFKLKITLLDLQDD